MTHGFYQDPGSFTHGSAQFQTAAVDFSKCRVFRELSHRFAEKEYLEPRMGKIYPIFHKYRVIRNLVSKSYLLVASIFL